MSSGATHSALFSDLFLPAAGEAAAAAMGNPWKVLLVDDEQDVHAVLHLALQDVVIDGRPLLLLLVLPAVPAQHQHCALVLQTEDAGGYPAAGDDVPADGDERPLLGLNRVNLRRRRQLLVVGLLASREKTLNSSKF